MKTNTFIELANTMYINVMLIDKLVRDKNNNYVLLLKNKERFIIPSDKAFSLIRLGIVNGKI